MVKIFLKTVRHFFPQPPDWPDQWPGSRFQPTVRSPARFLCRWGRLLFGLGPGGRRPADNDLRDLELAIRHNLNLLAGTRQTSLPLTRSSMARYFTAVASGLRL